MRSFQVISAGVLFASSLAKAGDLKTLASQYTAAKEKIGGFAEERAKQVQSKVSPILKQIAAIDTDESLSFLIRELDGSMPEIQAACADPVSRSSNPKAVDFLGKGLAKRPKAVSIAILEALGKTKHDLSPEEGELLQMAQGIQDGD